MNEYLNAEICKMFAVDLHPFTSPGVVDSTIEAINSSEPDILDTDKDPYRNERRVN